MAVKWIDKTELSMPNSPEADSAILAASWVLYKLTAEKYPGLKTHVEWYGADVDLFRMSDYGAASNLVGLSLFEVSDFQKKYLKLRRQPVNSITSISVGNASIDSSKYFIANHASIARTDGLFWDFSQGLTVEYTSGILPPEMGIRAVRRLADELILAVENESQCALPERAKSFQRQGISYTLLDPQLYLEQGKTGIYEIDLFITTANPRRAKKRPKVFSVDIPAGRKTTS